MEWKLYDDKGNFLQDVNCQYDACDVARWDYNAVYLHLDFAEKAAHIITREGDLD